MRFIKRHHADVGQVSQSNTVSLCVSLRLMFDSRYLTPLFLCLHQDSHAATDAAAAAADVDLITMIREPRPLKATLGFNL